MPLLLAPYAARAMFLVKIARPLPCYGYKKTYPISARVLLQTRNYVTYYVRKEAWPNISVVRELLLKQDNFSYNHSKAMVELYSQGTMKGSMLKMNEFFTRIAKTKAPRKHFRNSWRQYLLIAIERLWRIIAMSCIRKEAQVLPLTFGLKVSRYCSLFKHMFFPS